MLGWLFGNKPKDDDSLRCVACDSRNLTVLAPKAYQCNACGHQGGDGWADWQDMQTRARYDDWTVAQLREHAAAQLNEGRAALNAVSHLRLAFELRWQTDDRVRVNVPLRLQDEESAELELARQTATDIELALGAAQAKARATAITVDALVDKGHAHLRPTYALLQQMALFVRRDTPTDTVEAWRTDFEHAIQQVG